MPLSPSPDAAIMDRQTVSTVWLSSASTDIFNRNTLSHFANSLPRQLADTLSRPGAPRWEAGVHQVSFASQFSPLTADELQWPLLVGVSKTDNPIADAEMVLGLDRHQRPPTRPPTPEEMGGEDGGDDGDDDDGDDDDDDDDDDGDDDDGDDGDEEVPGGGGRDSDQDDDDDDDDDEGGGGGGDSDEAGDGEGGGGGGGGGGGDDDGGGGDGDEGGEGGDGDDRGERRSNIWDTWVSVGGGVVSEEETQAFDFPELESGDDVIGDILDNALAFPEVDVAHDPPLAEFEEDVLRYVEVGEEEEEEEEEGRGDGDGGDDAVEGVLDEATVVGDYQRVVLWVNKIEDELASFLKEGMEVEVADDEEQEGGLIDDILERLQAILSAVIRRQDDQYAAKVDHLKREEERLRKDLVELDEKQRKETEEAKKRFEEEKETLRKEMEADKRQLADLQSQMDGVRLFVDDMNRVVSKASPLGDEEWERLKEAFPEVLPSQPIRSDRGKLYSTMHEILRWVMGHILREAEAVQLVQVKKAKDQLEAERQKHAEKVIELEKAKTTATQRAETAEFALMAFRSSAKERLMYLANTQRVAIMASLKQWMEDGSGRKEGDSPASLEAIVDMLCRAAFATTTAKQALLDAVNVDVTGFSSALWSASATHLDALSLVEALLAARQSSAAEDLSSVRQDETKARRREQTCREELAALLAEVGRQLVPLAQAIVEDTKERLELREFDEHDEEDVDDVESIATALGLAKASAHEARQLLLDALDARAGDLAASTPVGRSPDLAPSADPAVTLASVGKALQKAGSEHLRALQETVALLQNRVVRREAAAALNMEKKQKELDKLKEAMAERQSQDTAESNRVTALENDRDRLQRDRDLCRQKVVAYEQAEQTWEEEKNALNEKMEKIKADAKEERIKKVQDVEEHYKGVLKELEDETKRKKDNVNPEIKRLKLLDRALKHNAEQLRLLGVPPMLETDTEPPELVQPAPTPDEPPPPPSESELDRLCRERVEPLEKALGSYLLSF